MHECELERDLLVAVQCPENYYAWVRKQVGEFTLLTSYWAIVIDELKALGIRWMCDSVEDSEACYVNERTLAKMIPFLTYPVSYASEPGKIDCGDYALWAASDASKIFKLNGVLEIWGKTPYNPPDHAWAGIQVAENKYLCWEPNAGLEAAGELFKVVGNKYNYKAEKWR